MPGRHDRESDDFGPELEGTTMDTAIESFVFKEGNNKPAESTLLTGPYRRKRELCLPPGDMA
jgi:uncharacterized protein YheU (UPF0270 family)